MTWRDETISALAYLFGPFNEWKSLERDPRRKYDIYISFFSNVKRGLAILRHLEDLGIIVREELTTPEFKACLEKAKEDRRIKDPRKYCMKKHPFLIILKVNYDILRHYWEQWRKARSNLETYLTFYDWLIYTIPET